MILSNIKNIIPNKFKWIFHPVFIFISLSLTIITSFMLYIYWYIEIMQGLEFVINKFELDPGQILKTQTGFVFIVLSMLVTLVLIGMFLAFIYYQKTLQIYRLQHNFINNFTHELKTPVTSINLYLKTLLKHKIPEKDTKKYINYMLKDVDRLYKNINKILNLAEIESGIHKEKILIVDVEDKIRNFYNKNNYLFKNLDIKINSYLKDKFKSKMNLSLFEMLLINISVNAIKYNKSKKPKLEINITLNKNNLEIRFKDNGIGLKKNELKKIFRKFYQVNKEEYTEGSGLGLYLVQNITKIHNWKIKAEHTENGATFLLIMNRDL